MIDRDELRLATRGAIEQIEMFTRTIRRHGQEWPQSLASCETIANRLEEALAVVPAWTETPERSGTTSFVHDGAGRTGPMWDCKCGESFESRGARTTHIREANQ